LDTQLHKNLLAFAVLCNELKIYYIIFVTYFDFLRVYFGRKYDVSRFDVLVLVSFKNVFLNEDLWETK